MGEIATSNRLITMFYSSDSIRAKKALAIAKDEGLRIQKIDILKSKLTGTQIAELAEKLNIKIKDLINQEHPAYHEKFLHHELSGRDWIKLIQHNPEIMKQPIVLHGDKTILVETPTDILKI